MRREITRRGFLTSAAAFAALPAWCVRESHGVGSGLAPWERIDGTASDTTLVRRAYLDFAGRLPTASEARAFVDDGAADKFSRLVDKILASDDYADYWSMRLCDRLRVKSEFPINLWPNAVYVYHRRIREAVASDEPMDAFARSLIMGAGSNFRDPESNYLRASSDRSPEGLARTAVRTFLDMRLEELPDSVRRNAVAAFSGVGFKSTREWKEELVTASERDGRKAFVSLLDGSYRKRFAAALAGYVNDWIFGRRGADDAMGEALIDDGFRLKAFCRRVALSASYSRGSVTGGFPVRRMDAEVLEDALCTLTGMKRSYSSIAPEPFTFLPPERKSVLIEDGSISSRFLTLFGRPPRDTGLPEERLGEVSAAQRMYLFNSNRIYRGLSNVRGKPEDLYWAFFSRPPTGEERVTIAAARPRTRDLAWCLANTREFLYRT